MGAPKTSDGKPVVSIFPTEGSRKTLVSHNWCDKTTWYQESTRVVDEIPDALTPGVTYQLDNQFVIDTYHGKLWAEDDLLDADGNSYRVLVEVDSGSGFESKEERDPHVGSGGDFTLDYDTGTITFDPPIGLTDDVRVTYHYAGSSVFTIKPTEGKVLLLKSAEVQFSTDVNMLDTVKFVAYGYVDVFAPQLSSANGGPIPTGTKIPVNTTTYKTMYDFQAESNGAMPTMPTLGGSGWRGIQHSFVVFSWNYAALLALYSNYGMEVRIYLEHDDAFTGEFATATVYALTEDA
jgi:hypothetical protein